VKILHINAGLEEGGAKTHILSLLSQFPSGMAELLLLEEGSISQEARLLGIKVHVIKQRSRYDLTILKRLIDFIKVNHYDVVHTHGARSNLLLALIRKRLNLTWVATVHSDPVLDFMGNGLKGKIFSYLNLKSLKKVDKLIAVTERLKSDLIKKDVSKEKIFVVYNGIIFGENPVVKKTHTIFTLTCVARLHPVKAHDFLFEVLKSSGLTNFHLNVVGDGELRHKLELKVSELKLEKQIQFHGSLDKLEIEKILQQTDVTVLTSLSEGFPLVLLESAEQKIPFISTNVGDIAKLVPDSSYGWLIPSLNPNALSAALKEAYVFWQTGTLSAKGEKLFELASKKFSLKSAYLETIRVYEAR